MIRNSRKSGPGDALAGSVLLFAAGEMALDVVKRVGPVLDELKVKFDVDRSPVGFAHLDTQKVGAGPHQQPAPGRKAIRFPTVTWKADPGDPAKALGEPPDDYQKNGQDLEKALTGLVREMLATPGNHPISSRQSQHRVDVYVIVDLCERDNVEAAIEAVPIIMDQLCNLELTGILITGRSADYKYDESRWREGLRRIAQANESKTLFHRAYLVDGRNSRQQWVATPADLCHMTARFLVHHALSPYRYELRAYERSRFSNKQGFGEVLGSFSCQMLSSDTELVQESVAEWLLNDVLPPAGCPLAQDDQDDVNMLAEQVKAELLAEIQRYHASVDEENGEAHAAEAKDYREAFAISGRANQILSYKIQRACGEDPRGRLPEFFRQLRGVTGRLKNQLQVLERPHERNLVGHRLGEQLRQLQHGDPRVPGRSNGDSSVENHAWLAQPISRRQSLAGLVILIIGVVVAMFIHDRNLSPLPVALGVLLVGVLVRDMPARFWRRCRIQGMWIGATFRGEVPVREGAAFRHNMPLVVKGEDGHVPRTPYRCRRSRWRVWAGLIIAAIGVVMIGYSLELVYSVGNNPVNGPTLIEMAVMGGIALLCVVLGVYQRPNDKRSGQPFLRRNVDGSDSQPSAIHWVKTNYPLAYFPRTFGLQRLLCYAVLTVLAAYVVTNWPIGLRQSEYDFPFPNPPENGRWLIRAGFVFLGVGLWLASWSGRCKDQLCIPVTPPNWRLSDIFGRLRVAGDRLSAELREVLHWLEALLDDRKQPRPDELNWPRDPNSETFLNVVAPDWSRRFADQCRTYVEAAVLDPAVWSHCVLERLRYSGDDDLTGETLDRAVVLHAVRTWFDDNLECKDWTALLRALSPQRNWLGRFFHRSLPPMWPTTDNYVEMDSGLALVDEQLAVASAAAEVNIDSRWRIQRAFWPAGNRAPSSSQLANPSATHNVVMIRIVQGLPKSYLASLMFEAESDDE